MRYTIRQSTFSHLASMLSLGSLLTSSVWLGGCDIEDPSTFDTQPMEWVGTERLDGEQVPDDSPRYLVEVEPGDGSTDRVLDDELPDIVVENGVGAEGTWTQWYDRDNPGRTGDWEALSLQSGACSAPSGVQCRTVQGLYLWETGENVSCSVDGLLCKNADQPDGYCDHDYKVRFLCPDEAHPLSADDIYTIEDDSSLYCPPSTTPGCFSDNDCFPGETCEFRWLSCGGICFSEPSQEP